MAAHFKRPVSGAALFGAFLLLVAFGAPPGGAQALSDAQIVEWLIADSIAAYPGNCPCPYNRASNGSRCGKRSAWSRSGGYAPLCYPDDVTPAMIAQYRQAHGG